MDTRLTRRAALLGLVAASPRPAQAGLPGVATLLVPGPEDGGYARWAARLSLAFGRAGTGHAAAPRLAPQVLGAPDGVTAANRFATEAGPDGRTLLVVTALALQARLVGDRRTHFDGAGWLPVCAARHAPIAVVGRGPLPDAGASLRLGLGPAEAAETAALLALDLIGRRATPVMGLSPEAARAALAQGAVDAIPLALDAAAPVDIPGRPWFLLEEREGRETVPDVPTVRELVAHGPAPLQEALRVVTANASLLAAVVLPALTPANVVAAWRGHARRWTDEERAPGLRAVPGQHAGPLLAGLGVAPETSAAYRAWLLDRLNWQV